MIKLEHTVLSSPEQMQFVIEGMRNPMNSWDKSDSGYNMLRYDINGLKIGKNDYSLMQKLNTEHLSFSMPGSRCWTCDSKKGKSLCIHRTYTLG